MLFEILALVACLLFVVRMWLRPRFESPQPPLYPGSLPIIGNALQFLGNNVELWKYLKRLSYHSLESGGVSRLYLGPHRIYMHMWKRHRKIINPIFSQRMLNKFLEVFNSQARRLVSQFEGLYNKGEFDQQPMLVTNALETVCLVIMGLKEGDLDTIVKEYSEAVLDLLGLFIEKNQKIWLHVPIIFKYSSTKTKQEELIRRTSQITNSVIQKRKAKLKERLAKKYMNEPNTDHLLYVSLKRNEFSDDEIREHLETIVVTGYDTSAVTLTFALKLIGMHPSVQKRIYDEIQEVTGDTNDDITKNDLPRLVYLEAVIKETLRIYPTVPLAARQIMQNIKLKNCTLKADSIGVISVFGVHRHPKWGSDVEQFRPERWLDPSAVPNSPYIFASFSLGKRNCIGRLYAMMSIKTTLAHILRRYHVLATASSPIPKYDISLRSVSGHEISLEDRELHRS